MSCLSSLFIFFFFNDTATTEIYTLSLHDALPISGLNVFRDGFVRMPNPAGIHGDLFEAAMSFEDRKSTRLNSSHSQISYAVFCLKKKKKQLRRCTSLSCRSCLCALQRRPVPCRIF